MNNRTCCHICCCLIFIFLNDIRSDIFKHVKSDIKIEKLNVTLNDAAKKQINNYTSQQVSNKKNDAWRDASATEIKSAMDSGTFIDNEKQKYQF